MRHKNGHPVERFLFKVEITEGCWLWKGDILANGYGYFWLGRRPMYAHRFAYIAFVAEIPDGETIDHLCRVTACVRPSHLEAVSHRINVQRGLVQVHPIKVAAANRHCRNGHWMDEENTYHHQSGYPRCRKCAAERNRTGRPRGRPKSDTYPSSLPAQWPPSATAGSNGPDGGPHRRPALSESSR